MRLSVHEKQADSIRKVAQKFRLILILWKRHGVALTLDVKNRFFNSFLSQEVLQFSETLGTFYMVQRFMV